MVRTQIYLTPPQHRRLKGEAARAGLSMTELLRRIVDVHLKGGRALPFKKEACPSFIGLGTSGRRRTSERHDQALDEAFRGGALR
jgi:hypothetical protein